MKEVYLFHYRKIGGESDIAVTATSLFKAFQKARRAAGFCGFHGYHPEPHTWVSHCYTMILEFKGKEY